LEEKAGHITAIFRWEEKIPVFKGIVNYLKKTLTEHMIPKREGV
jgi:hypothetical protein